MAASAELLELYDEWKALTLREGKAILASDWAEVRHCQKAKEELQPAIVRRTEAAKAAAGAQERELDEQVRAIVNELIQLESDNDNVLKERFESLEQAQGDLNRTAQSLRRIHRSYVPAQGPVWNQYS